MASFIGLKRDRIQTLTTKIPATEKNLAFGYTNALLAATPTLDQPILHFWEMPPTLILGLKDKRLPALATALTGVQRAGYEFVLRNSGGLAVVSDAGILNVSLFVPFTDQTPISVDAAYQQMTDLIAATFPSLPIEHYEITRSYCPGDYDLSVRGQKIAGIAQRRSTQAVVTMLYMSVSGNQDQRSSMVRAFYTTGLNGQPNTLNFPDVDPAVMTTVAALTNHPLTNDQVADQIKQVMVSNGVTVGQGRIQALLSEPQFQSQLARQTAQMAKRQPHLA